MRSATRLVLGALGLVGLVAGVLLGFELVDAPRSVLSVSAYSGLGGAHRWALLAVVAALPLVVSARWTPADRVGPRTRLRPVVMVATVPVGLVLAAVLPRHHGEVASLAFVFAAYGAATLFAAPSVVPQERRGALQWAGAMLLCAGVLRAGAASLEALSWWAELGQGWAVRSVLVGLPFAAALRDLDLPRPTRRLLAAALVVFTLCGGALQPLRAMCAVVAIKVWRQSTRNPGQQLARTWLLGSAGLLVVSECGAAIIGMRDPFADFSYVPVAQMHYLAAAGFSGAAALYSMRSAAAAPGQLPERRSRLWARSFVLAAHVCCGALLLLGRAGMPRGFVAYVDPFEPLFRVAAVGAVITLMAAAVVARPWARAS